MNTGEIVRVFIILLAFAILLGVFLGAFFKVPYGNIAVVKITGEITSEGGGILSSGTSSEEIASILEEARLNPSIEAVILDINSGGGASVASAEVVRAVKEVGKPTIALIRDVGASGAYWIASAADYVIAHDLSLVGSIGVTMNYLEFSGLLKRYNVTYVNLSYPEHKDILSQYRPLTSEENDWVTQWLEHAYDYFLTDVAANRNKTKDEMSKYANGSVFMGYQALSYGLIDELGGMSEAINKTMQLANITEPIKIEYPAQTTSILDLLSGINGKNEVTLRI